MGNHTAQATIESWTFLMDEDATGLFGKIDYKLKDGFHFQNIQGQYDAFRFIQNNEESLKLYYLNFFGIQLQSGGVGIEKYYYLNFTTTSRGNIDLEHRYFLKSEFVIVGFLVYKIVYIDRNIELNSVRKLQNMISRDYETLRPGLYKLIAKIKKEKVTEMNNEKVDFVVLDALREFDKLGWINLENDFFDINPSFMRLIKLYEDYINNIDELIQSHNS